MKVLIRGNVRIVLNIKIINREIVDHAGIVICKDIYNNKSYFKDGLSHRENNKPATIYNNNKYYYKNGKLHRENGPAIEKWNGTKEYYLNGLPCIHSVKIQKKKSLCLSLIRS